MHYCRLWLLTILLLLPISSWAVQAFAEYSKLMSKSQYALDHSLLALSEDSGRRPRNGYNSARKRREYTGIAPIFLFFLHYERT